MSFFPPQLRYVRCVLGLACKKSQKECILSHICTSSNCNMFIVVFVLSGCFCRLLENSFHSHNCGLRHSHVVCLLNFTFELVQIMLATKEFSKWRQLVKSGAKWPHISIPAPTSAWQFVSTHRAFLRATIIIVSSVHCRKKNMPKIE